MPYKLFFFIIFLCFSCASETKKDSSATNEKVKVIESAPFDYVKEKKKMDDLRSKGIPIFGHRFVITGDFDGDGKKDTLMEHYYNQKTNTESHKFFAIRDSINQDFLF